MEIKLSGRWRVLFWALAVLMISGEGQILGIRLVWQLRAVAVLAGLASGALALFFAACSYGVYPGDPHGEARQFALIVAGFATVGVILVCLGAEGIAG